MNIPTNDGVLNTVDNKVINEMTEKILSQLKTESTAQLYSYGTAYNESRAKIVGRAFANKGYYVAYDYVPNGYRNITVSKMPIGESSGRLVSRRWE
jgi:hypothetical protein